MVNKQEAIVLPIKFDTDLGTVSIDNNVVATIAGLSAMESYGIVGMASKNAADGLFELLKWDHFSKGINVTSKENTLNIDLHIIVEYGVQISVVSKNIKDRVKYNIEKTTDLKVDTINIFVEGIRLEK